MLHAAVPHGALWGAPGGPLYALQADGRALWTWDRVGWTELALEDSAATGGIAGDGTSVFVTGDGGGVMVTDGGQAARVTETQAASVSLHAAWAAGPADVFAVGELGTIVHGGVDWVPMPTEDVRPLWATEGALFGESNAAIERFDGQQWSALAPVGAIRDLTLRPGGGAIAVGDGGTYTLDDGVWTASSVSGVAVWSSGDVVLSTGGSIEVRQLVAGQWLDVFSSLAQSDLWGTSATDVYLVGNNADILHFDGTGWQQVATGGASYLFGVWGSSPTDVFAVGTSGLIRHYDGSVWDLQYVGSGVLHAVWGSSGSNVFAVGQGGQIHRYDGATWSAMTSPVTTRLYAVWGRSATEVYAAGEGGVILRYDGATWSTMATPTTLTFFGLAGDAGVVYALGAAGVARLDGATWTIDLPSMSRPQGAFGFSATDVYFAAAAGLLHYDGAAVTSLVDTAGPLWSVWGTAGDDLYVADSNGVSRFDGATLTPVGTAPGSCDLWGTSGSDLYCARYGIYRYDGVDWTLALEGDFTSVWGSGADDVFGVGYGAAARWDGATWTPFEVGLETDHIAVWGRGRDDVFILGDDSSSAVLYHYDGAGLTPIGAAEGQPISMVGTATDLFFRRVLDYEPSPLRLAGGVR